MNQGQLSLHRGTDGRLCMEAQDVALASTDLLPIEHLAASLGGCLSEFAARFLERRGMPTHMRIGICWRISVQRCCVERFDVALYLDATLDEADRQTLHRMLDQCPVHKALQGNVYVDIRVCHPDTGLSKLEDHTVPLSRQAS